MRTPGLWASMRGIRYMPFARLAKPKAIPPAYAAYLMGLFVRHALRAGRSGFPLTICYELPCGGHSMG